MRVDGKLHAPAVSLQKKEPIPIW